MSTEQKPYNAARDGWTVKKLADLLAMYAKHSPDVIVQFNSSESGGRWPADRQAMGVFTDSQCSVVDDTLCGGGVTFNVALLAFDKDGKARSK